MEESYIVQRPILPTGRAQQTTHNRQNTNVEGYKVRSTGRKLQTEHYNLNCRQNT